MNPISPYAPVPGRETAGRPPSDRLDGLDDGAEVSLQKLLSTQLQLADIIQKYLIRVQTAIDPKDLQTLSNTATSMLTLAHKTDASLKELNTYRVFVDAVLAFLEERSDSLGEDLVARLKEKAAELSQARG